MGRFGADFIFWACAGLVLYTYAGYPLVLLAAKWLTRGKGGPPRRSRFSGTVSVVIAARNEREAVGRRVAEFTRLLCGGGRRGEIIVVSDGSTDGTGDVGDPSDAENLRVIRLARHRGKAAAVSEGVAAASGEVVVLADCRQTWAPDALERLLENFADPRVGATSGDLVVECVPGVMGGIGMYWRYEKWLRKTESLVYSATGVSGSICAVRRALFCPIPDGTILDDVYWPLRVAMSGYRVIHDERAIAYDRLPEQPAGEFRRKVRTLSGNFQLISRLPASVVPGLNLVWLQFVSHKLLRLVVPWALIAMLVINVTQHGVFWHVTLAGQVLFYAAGLLAGVTRGRGPLRRLSPVASFLLLNAACWAAFWVWVSGRSTQSWGQTTYGRGPAGEAAKSISVSPT